MTELEAKNRYIVAHVRANIRGNCDQWSLAEMLDVYLTMRPPVVSFNEWYTSSTAFTEPVAVPKPEPTPEQIEEINEEAIKNITSILPFVTVGTK